MFFDYYGMGGTWPGRTEARKKNQATKPVTVEKAIREDIKKGKNGTVLASRFLPYIQMHEFEALLFSDSSTLPDVLQDPNAENSIEEIRDEFATPEEINDSSTTAPSKRLEVLFASYQKTLHGPLAAKRIGIAPMLRECPHFKEWVDSIKKFPGCK